MASAWTTPGGSRPLPAREQRDSRWRIAGQSQVGSASSDQRIISADAGLQQPVRRLGVRRAATRRLLIAVDEPPRVGVRRSRCGYRSRSALDADGRSQEKECAWSPTEEAAPDGVLPPLRRRAAGRRVEQAQRGFVQFIFCRYRRQPRRYFEASWWRWRASAAAQGVHRSSTALAVRAAAALPGEHHGVRGRGPHLPRPGAPVVDHVLVDYAWVACSAFSTRMLPPDVPLRVTREVMVAGAPHALAPRELRARKLGVKAKDG